MKNPFIPSGTKGTCQSGSSVRPFRGATLVLSRLSESTHYEAVTGFSRPRLLGFGVLTSAKRFGRRLRDVFRRHRCGVSQPADALLCQREADVLLPFTAFDVSAIIAGLRAVVKCCSVPHNSVLIEIVKKLRWAVIAGLGVLVACGSLLISQRGSPPQGERAVPVVRPVPPEQPSSVLPVLGKKPSLEDVQSLYRQGQRQLYNSALGEKYLRARELLQNAQALLDQLDDEITETDRLYWQARLEFELGNWYHGAAWGDPAQAQEALPYYLTAEQIAQKLTERAPDFSDGYRLVGETQMRIISLKGWLQALTGARVAKNNLERALELDPRNAEAHLALGVYYLYAPTLFGGDLDKALREFAQSEALTSDETVRFLSYRWRGVAYAKLGKIAEAKEAFQRALAIYPESSWDQNELSKLR